jgi:hypothetical protein
MIGALEREDLRTCASVIQVGSATAGIRAVGLLLLLQQLLKMFSG